MAAGVGLGEPVVREDALLVAHCEPLSKAVAVAPVDAEPLVEGASVTVAAPEDDAHSEGLCDREVQPEGLPLGELLPVGEPKPLGDGDCEVRDGVANPLKELLREPHTLAVLSAECVATGVPLQQAVVLTSPEADTLAEGWEEPVAARAREPEGKMVVVSDGAAEIDEKALTADERVPLGVAV